MTDKAEIQICARRYMLEISISVISERSPLKIQKVQDDVTLSLWFLPFCAVVLVSFSLPSPPVLTKPHYPHVAKPWP